MAGLLSRLFGSSSMCENCGRQPKYAGFDYCGKSCSVEAEKKKRSAPGLGCRAPGSLRQPAAPGPPRMCKNCNTKPAFSSYSYCGKTCAEAAKANKRTQAAPPCPNGLCAFCQVRPAHGSHRHCGKTCASMAARQRQPYNAAVIGYSAGYQVPMSPSDNGPYVPPSGYPTAGPPYSYSPGSPMDSSPRGYKHSQRGGSRPPPPRRTPNRAPPRSRSTIAATDFGSEDEYPSEGSDDDRRRPVRRPISRREEGDSPSGSDSGYPTSEVEEERGDRRPGDDQRSSSAQPDTGSSQSNAASSSGSDTLCIVCRRFPKYSGHPFCSRQCRDSLILSQAQGIAPYPMAPGVGQAPFSGASMPPPVSDVPPPYSDTEDR